jgi:hypothetical protein
VNVSQLWALVTADATTLRTALADGRPLLA